MIFRGLSAASVRVFVSSPHVPLLCRSVAFGSSVSMMKQQKTILSVLSSNKRSRRVAGKLYNNFRGKQNKAYVLAMKKQFGKGILNRIKMLLSKFYERDNPVVMCHDDASEVNDCAQHL